MTILSASVWVPCTEDHIRMVDLREQQISEDVRGELTLDAQFLARFARTMMEGDRILGCVGIVPLWEGVAHAWAYLSQESVQKPIALAKGVRFWLHWIEEEEKLRRIQATADLAFVQGRRFLEWLGFEREAILKDYGPTGRDYVLYARLRHVRH